MTDPKRLREQGPSHIFDLEFYEKRMPAESKAWVEAQFPTENYGETILIYEAWGMRHLLEMAYAAGMAASPLLDRLDSARVIIEKSYECCDCAKPLSKAWLDANGEGK